MNSRSGFLKFFFGLGHFGECLLSLAASALAIPESLLSGLNNYLLNKDNWCLNFITNRFVENFVTSFCCADEEIGDIAETRGEIG